MATLAEIRAKLKEQESKTTTSSGPSDNAIFPFWNAKPNTTSTIRFLPDKDEENVYFWLERSMFKFPFSGIKGETGSRPVTVSVPCMEMYGETCDVLNEVRTWFKDPSLEAMGRKYWKKRSYIFQGFVIDSAIEEENKPENPVRRFIIGPQVFNIIKASLMDPDIEELPTDFVHGLDFRLTKTEKGEYADYSTSTWARKERALSDDELNAVKEHGLFNLSDFIPKKPTEVELKVIKEMFEASVDGEEYDPDRWSQYYRPAGMSASSAPAKPVASTPVSKNADSTEDTPPFVVDEKPAKEEPADASSNAQDILAMIRARQS